MKEAHPAARRTLLLVLAAAVFAAPSMAHAADFYGAAGPTGGGSEWAGDPSIQGALRGGFEFGDIVGIELQGRLGYSAVDERLLSLISIGTKLAIPIDPVFPYTRIHLLHQHEEPLAGVAEDGVGAVFGVGDAIRHRFGFETALGVGWTFARSDALAVSTFAEAFVDVLPDDRGPVWYGGGGVGIGLDYTIGGAGK